MPRAVPHRADEAQVLRTLVVLATSVARGASGEDLVELAAATARDLLAADSVSISEVVDQGRRIRVLINVGDLGPGEVRRPRAEVYEVADYPRSLAFLRDPGIPALHCSLDDPHGEPSEQALIARLGKRSSLNASIVVDGATWGTLFATRGHDAADFEQRDADLADVIAALVGAGLTHGRAWSALSALADTDPLTGLANRRLVDRYLARPDLPAGGGLALAVADVNGLKRLNDTRGHAAGDEALRHVAAAASAVVTSVPGGLAGRLGGDEFVLVLPAVSRDAAQRLVGEWCARAVRRDLRVSLACGLAYTADPTVPADALLRHADLAQYQAKRERSAGPVLRDVA